MVDMVDVSPGRRVSRRLAGPFMFSQPMSSLSSGFSLANGGRPRGRERTQRRDHGLWNKKGRDVSYVSFTHSCGRHTREKSDILAGHNSWVKVSDGRFQPPPRTHLTVDERFSSSLDCGWSWESLTPPPS